MEREQFIALISEEQESLRRFLLALCEGDRMEAEDIAQEAMVKAYIAMERFVERTKF
ncbi:MAG: RNA polymerase sigma factor, partial [Bacteroidales bacterium]|nr:RNA polymerase sigma factor [Bacteroidales bacterium]